MKLLRVVVLIFSITLNIGFLLNWINQPLQRFGILSQDVQVQINDKTWIILPKGITVEDASPQGLAGIGQFEKHRFSIIVTSDSANLVNFNVDRQFLCQDGPLYHGETYRGVDK